MQESVLVIGYGASGQSAKELLESHGYKCFVYDDRKSDLSYEAIESLEFKFAVVSPGVSPDHPVCSLVKKREKKLVGEASYALKHIQLPMLAVTGTNGKTTVTLLCEHVLNTLGYKALACGNVSKDRPLSKIALSHPEGAILVVELSSFQLENLSEPQFLSSVILNITPDHLDRYQTMQDYALAKCRVLSLAQTNFVHASVKSHYGDLIDENAYVYDLDSCPESFHTIESVLDRLNAMSAFLLLSPFNVSCEEFLRAYASFKKPQHRMQLVAEVGGVRFINDSKATNIDATIQALVACQQSTILLAGGVDKGHPYTDWLPYLSKIKHIACFGQAKQKIFDELSGYASLTLHDKLLDALDFAKQLAKPGDTVLLSPGCSSFDEFQDYQHRGQVFCQNVMAVTI